MKGMKKSVVIKLEGKEEMDLYRKYHTQVVKKTHSTLMGYNKELFLKSIKEEIENSKE